MLQCLHTLLALRNTPPANLSHDSRLAKWGHLCQVYQLRSFHRLPLSWSQWETTKKTALWLWTRKITCYWGCTNWFNYFLLQLSKNYEDWIMQSYNLPVSSPSPLHKTQKQNFIPQKYFLTTVFSPFLFNLYLLLNKFWEIAAYIAILAYQWQKVTCREQDDTAFIGYFWRLHSPQGADSISHETTYCKTERREIG